MLSRGVLRAADHLDNWRGKRCGRAVFCQIGHYLPAIGGGRRFVIRGASPRSSCRRTPRGGSSCIDDTTTSSNGCNSAVLHIDQSRRDVGAAVAAAVTGIGISSRREPRANIFLAKRAEQIFDRFTSTATPDGITDRVCPSPGPESLRKFQGSPGPPGFSSEKYLYATTCCSRLHFPSSRALRAPSEKDVTPWCTIKLLSMRKIVSFLFQRAERHAQISGEE